MQSVIGWTLGEWHAAYRSGAMTPDRLLSLAAQYSADDSAWIARAQPEQLAMQLAQLNDRLDAVGGDIDKLPLYGVPFAIKDNIDAAGWDTTAACPEFAYSPTSDATVVAKLRAAGAILMGKTNLDQFATGLVGTRSPYGAVGNSFNADYVSGGSSSGSASVVARGLVAFALGTDTAGSGRVPAGFNNIVGLKPTKGRFSNTGLVSACRTLDCISVFALTVEDAAAVAQVAQGYDASDAYSRSNPYTAPVSVGASIKLAIPASLEFFGDTQNQAVFEQAVEHFKALGAVISEVDFSAFKALADQLYSGPWVAERTVALEGMLEHQPQAINPVVRGIVENGLQYSACDAYKAEYLRAELSRRINDTLAGFDALLVPTSPTIRTRADMVLEPVRYNAQFGYYTNFTNLADLSALALPAGLRADGLPCGITLLAPAWHDSALAHLGQRWQASLELPLGATERHLPAPAAAQQAPGTVRVAVVGAHLSGMPLNFQLTTRNAVLVEQTLTASTYRLYALPGTVPPKPGLARAEGGRSIIVELWDMPIARFGEFVAEIPAPLGIGTLMLADGRSVKGFICEPWALADALDVTEFGGWRAYVTSKG
ncbi:MULTISPECIES: allophanate hydrolase [unclassified Pseudomonas]|uniref:allophanate hydrolase n=1 Tax=unclassified Pseudomonas TaxID=196821 RepID=UPI000C88C2A0|nr:MULTISPECIES: allophanate hydrolase [unclassified Pseudomonas]PMX29307.1 allophanate hydrolase [Pseudomonas sp. GW460-12]PMX29801.1 allophanate hydrolase [Pseudomonas sp. MPR-R2A4]PMX31347.1 allophanate hydrolase [Pseudomonas sp. MPR-R2A7]PMX51129.1 allophanate hydrolase [Pseudomonas sp. MPR-R2A6]PMX80743.1 allophanate hydrolase [Pseudomonas sp. MPR-R2A3]